MNRDKELLINFIEKNFPTMPKTFDEGLGIASERYSVNKVLEQVIELDKLERVLEAPVDGLMGIPGMNSVFFARNNIDVTIGSPSTNLLKNAEYFWKCLELDGHVKFLKVIDKFPFSDNTFDLVWNYSMFEHFEDGNRFLNEMRRVSSKYVFLITQNAYNYGYPIHKIYHFKKREEWDHGYSKWMKLRNLKQLFEKNELDIVMCGCVDVPPWFDTFDMHTRGKIKILMREDEKKEWFWSSIQNEDMKKLSENKMIKKLRFFESILMWPFDYLFAHHFYILGEKK